MDTQKDMKVLEEELGYSISAKYEKRLESTPSATVRVTLVRLRFNFLFACFWQLIIAYSTARFAYHRYFFPFWFSNTLYVLGFLLVACAPWAYFVSTARPRPIWATLRALRAREVCRNERGNHYARP